MREKPFWLEVNLCVREALSSPHHIGTVLFDVREVESAFCFTKSAITRAGTPLPMDDTSWDAFCAAFKEVFGREIP